MGICFAPTATTVPLFNKARTEYHADRTIETNQMEIDLVTVRFTIRESIRDEPFKVAFFSEKFSLNCFPREDFDTVMMTVV